MDEIGELHRILDEEHRHVVADEIPVAFVRVELDREPAHVASGVGGSPLAEDGGESHKHRCLLPDLCEQRRARDIRQRFRALEKTVRGRPAGMDDALGNALVIEVGDLFAKDEIFEQRRTAQPGLQGVLIIRNRYALVGRQHTVGGIDAHAIKRAHRRVLANIRAAAADLVRAVHLRDGAGARNGIVGLDRCAFGRRDRGVGSYSAALFGLNAKADATSCVAAAFSAAGSPVPDASGAAGPLTVVRLFRTVLCFLVTFDEREDFAMAL